MRDWPSQIHLRRRNIHQHRSCHQNVDHRDNRSGNLRGPHDGLAWISRHAGEHGHLLQTAQRVEGELRKQVHAEERQSGHRETERRLRIYMWVCRRSVGMEEKEHRQKHRHKDCNRSAEVRHPSADAKTWHVYAQDHREQPDREYRYQCVVILHPRCMRSQAIAAAGRREDLNVGDR